MTDTKQIYEIGYLFIPTIPEDSLAEKVGKLKEGLEKVGASFISEDFPKMKTLAYKMSTNPDEVTRNVYDKAYFGWVKFELSPEVLPVIETDLKANKELIRYLLIKTVRENTIAQIATKAPVMAKAEETPAETEEEKKEIDESIDELVIE